jgi:transcriptional regulator with XRE-family HTH domain
MPKSLHLEEIAQPAAVLFGTRLKKRRKALGLTQAQMFEKTGIAPGYVSYIENGRANPTIDMMVKLAETVGLEIWDMLRPDNEPNAIKAGPETGEAE